MYDHSLHKASISDINIKSFEEAIAACFDGGIKNYAPLGFSSDDILLFGNVNGGRHGVVSVRNHSDMCELLITDIGGHFLCLCKYSPKLTYPVIAFQFMEAFELVKNFITPF